MIVVVEALDGRVQLARLLVHVVRMLLLVLGEERYEATKGALLRVAQRVQTHAPLVLLGQLIVDAAAAAAVLCTGGGGEQGRPPVGKQLGVLFAEEVFELKELGHEQVRVDQIVIRLGEHGRDHVHARALSCRVRLLTIGRLVGIALAAQLLQRRVGLRRLGERLQPEELHVVGAQLAASLQPLQRITRQLVVVALHFFFNLAALNCIVILVVLCFVNNISHTKLRV